MYGPATGALPDLGSAPRPVRMIVTAHAPSPSASSEERA